MADRCELYVTNVLEDGPAFAIREDNDEAVYIPKGIAQDLELEFLDEIEALIIPNKVEPEKTPWFCIRAILLEEEPAS